MGKFKVKLQRILSNGIGEGDLQFFQEEINDRV